MDYLQSHAIITNCTAAELTRIASENRLKQVFYRLATAEVIEPCPMSEALRPLDQKDELIVNKPRITHVGRDGGEERMYAMLTAAVVLVINGAVRQAGRPR